MDPTNSPRQMGPRNIDPIQPYLPLVSHFVKAVCRGIFALGPFWRVTNRTASTALAIDRFCVILTRHYLDGEGDGKKMIAADALHILGVGITTRSAEFVPIIPI